jgi:hypothetical protein
LIFIALFSDCDTQWMELSEFPETMKAFDQPYVWGLGFFVTVHGPDGGF